MANSDVKLKHKVQLRKKVEDPEVTVENEVEAPDNTPTPNEPKSNKWIWIILGIIVVCVLGYFLLSKSDDKTAQEPEVPSTESVQESVVPADSTEAATPSIEDEATACEDNQDVKESETPEAPATPVETPATTKSPSTATATNISNDVEAEAMKVIRGDYGVGQERKDKLGSQYKTIQSRVNELKREGIF